MNDDVSLKFRTGFAPRCFSTVHKGYLTCGPGLTVALSTAYAFELSEPGEWALMVKSSRSDVRAQPHHFRCRHKNPAEAKRWVNACLLNGAKLVRIKKN